MKIIVRHFSRLSFCLVVLFVVAGLASAAISAAPMQSDAVPAASPVIAGHANLPAPPPVPASVPMRQSDNVEIEEKSYNIEVSKGKLLRLDSPASAVIAADPAVADVQVLSPSLVYINGKTVGETTVFAIDSKDNEILRATITVTNNLTKLNKAVHEMVPSAQVNFQSIDGALVMNGDVDSPLQAEDVRRLAAPFVKNGQTLINMVHARGSDQVMLKVKVAEVDRSEAKSFGISLQNVLNGGNFAYGILQGRAVLGTTGAIAQGSNTNTIFGQYTSGGGTINGVIDALEDNGLLTTLAEPNLTTQSGQPASFLAGGEIPVPSVTGSGSTAQVSVAYQPYGVSLSFTPVVLSKDRISLVVAPEVSSISPTGGIVDAGFTIPALLTRKASTTVELQSGQSFAIAGLLENDNNNDINKFPFLGDLPVLGALFRSTNFQHNQTELVIIVTPFIVSPVNERKAMRDPTQGMVVANDAQRILLGKLYDETPPGQDRSQTGTDTGIIDKPRSNGPAGYILK
jgi:pilus assembly protein CpaC